MTSQICGRATSIRKKYYIEKRLETAWAARKYKEHRWRMMMSWIDNGYQPRSVAAYTVV
jgi:hypothetical protein